MANRSTTHFYGDDCRNGHHEPDVFETFVRGGESEVWMDCPCGWKRYVKAPIAEADALVKRALREHINQEVK